jgi:hypothetical protein
VVKLVAWQRHPLRQRGAPAGDVIVDAETHKEPIGGIGYCPHCQVLAVETGKCPAHLPSGARWVRQSLAAALARRDDLEFRAPTLAAGAGERLHADIAAVAAAVLDQRRQRHGEDALTCEAVAAHAMAVGVELAEGVDDDLVGGGLHWRRRFSFLLLSVRRLLCGRWLRWRRLRRWNHDHLRRLLLRGSYGIGERTRLCRHLGTHRA